MPHLQAPPDAILGISEGGQCSGRHTHVCRHATVHWCHDSHDDPTSFGSHSSESHPGCLRSVQKGQRLAETQSGRGSLPHGGRQATGAQGGARPPRSASQATPAATRWALILRAAITCATVMLLPDQQASGLLVSSRHRCCSTLLQEYAAIGGNTKLLRAFCQAGISARSSTVLRREAQLHSSGAVRHRLIAGMLHLV